MKIYPIKNSFIYTRPNNNILCNKYNKENVPTYQLNYASNIAFGENSKQIQPNSDDDFFGVTNVYNLNNRILNQLGLVVLKQKDLGCVTLSNKYLDEHFAERFWNKSAHKLDKAGAARITFENEKFNVENQNFRHTIALVKDDKDTLFVIDSLGNNTPNLKEFHDFLENVFKMHKGDNNYPQFKKIIFNTKQQQQFNKLSCSNWTMANIEAVLNAIKNNINIPDSETLDSILPDDETQILKEQEEYLRINKHKLKGLI